MKACATSTIDGRRGFTLAESLIAASLLAVTVVAVISPIMASYQQTEAAQQNATATTLARQLLDEIVAKPFVDPTDNTTSSGPEPDETNRSYYDNIDDYHGYRDASTGLSALDGTARNWSGRGVYQREVRVEYRSVADGPPTAGGDFVLVTVTVIAPGNQTLRLQRLASNYPLAIGGLTGRTP